MREVSKLRKSKSRIQSIRVMRKSEVISQGEQGIRGVVTGDNKETGRGGVGTAVMNSGGTNKTRVGAMSGEWKLTKYDNTTEVVRWETDVDRCSVS